MGVIVIKVGGLSTENLTDQFFDTIKYWQSLDKNIVIVHGGGAYITDMLDRLNIQTKTCDGLRVTDYQVLDVTKMILIGKMLPDITATFNHNDCLSVGVTAADQSCIEGKEINFSKYGYVGEITRINQAYFQRLFDENIIPIVSPLCLTENNQWLNVNADTTACALAIELHAEKLYLMTDVPGIKSSEKWLTRVSTSEVKDLIDRNIIKKGMLPKVQNAMLAIEQGVETVMITQSIWEDGTQIVN